MSRIAPNYKGKSAEMLTIVNITCTGITPEIVILLQKENSRATPEFITNLSQGADDAFVNILGADSAATMRNATIQVLGIFDVAQDALQKSKSSIDAALIKKPAVRDEVFNKLGFTTQEWKDVSDGDQEALVVCLARYSQNMDADTRALLTSPEVGVSVGRLDQPIQYYQELKDANVDQELFKSQRKQFTAEAQTTLNAIYTDLRFIHRIGKIVFKDQPDMLAMFTYSAIMKGLRRRTGSTSAAEEA